MTNHLNGSRYDALSHTLYLTESFLKKASVLGTPEYNCIREARKDATLKIEKEAKSKKHAPKPISFKQMEDYIVLFDDKQQTMLGNFKKIREMSKIQSSPYNYVKKWFENEFPHYKEQVVFDEKGKMTYVGEDKKDAAAPAPAVQADANAEQSLAPAI